MSLVYYCHRQINWNAHITLLWLRPKNQPLNFVAGQYITTSLINGKTLYLSIANVPHRNGELELHVRHDQSHPLGQMFLAQLMANPEIIIEGPYGNMTLNQIQDAKNLYFVAGGTGFAPLQALLIQALSTYLLPCHLYWGVRSPADAYALDLLNHYQDQYTQFSYTLVLSEPHQFPEWNGKVGLVGDYMLQHAPLEQACIFACGPFGMVRQLWQQWQELGLPLNRFYSDLVLS